jgi:hypothetical protein
VKLLLATSTSLVNTEQRRRNRGTAGTRDRQERGTGIAYVKLSEMVGSPPFSRLLRTTTVLSE